MDKSKRNDAAENATIPLLPKATKKKLGKLCLAACLLALFLSAHFIHIETRNDLRKTCGSVEHDFSGIMQSYTHSFRLFEKLVQLEIAHTEDADKLEAFLKEQDAKLLEIEGGDYDGVYMYYRGRYLYSWSTPFSVYAESGYDATKRPWYIGAVQANGEVFFSVPYPSYANDYMLATISRLQPDGETVVAYDIKLGKIGEFVDRLDIYNGALTLICDDSGNIIGSTEHRYLGGNYALSDDQLTENVRLAQAELDSADSANEKEKAALKLASAEAQRRFCRSESAFLNRLLQKPGRLRYDVPKLVFGYASGNGEYTCIVIASLVKLLPRLAVVWAAMSFFLILALFLITKTLGRNSQISTNGLTGLNNRRALLKYCENHILHHAGDTLSFIMLDLNDFKKINDRLGHVVGDHALLDTADALRKSCAGALAHFFLCRYGGDEFLLAGANCGQDDIEQMLALIRRELMKKNAAGVNPYLLEASIGVATGTCQDMGSVERLLVQADKAMYKEKTRTKAESET